MAKILVPLVLCMATATSGQHLSKIHVCGSGVPSLNGVYEIDDLLKSDDVPVFARIDQEGDSLKTDFRLFRHQGYWSFADFASWPPEVHFRCDPYLNGHEQSIACAKDQNEPPLEGYTPRTKGGSSNSVQSPVLQLEPCGLTGLPVTLHPEL